VIRTVWTFPGQLTEYVGMTEGLLAGASCLRENLEMASSLLGEDLAAICAEGPDSLLRRDDVAAAAVVASGVTCARELGRRGFQPDGTLGYSLGLYTAAAASRAISLEDALRLVISVAREGEAWFPPGRMAMGFVTGVRLSRLEAELADVLADGEIAVTNVNTPAQIVLAGEADALDAALTRLRPQAMRCERLRITRPYHSPWMEPVAAMARELCRDLEVLAPSVPLFDHKDGSRLESAEAVRRRLSEQLVTRVDWNASIRALLGAGARTFVEAPPGSSTTRMVRWIERDAGAVALDQTEDRERFFADRCAAGPRGGGGAGREQGIR